MDRKEKKHVAVIGAGIIGVSTAVWLLRQGIAVTLIDRNEPGCDKAASFGNACILAAVSVTPVTGPGLVSKSPKMLLDPDFPLFLRWSYLPKLTPWLLKYLSHANEKDTRRIAAGLAPLTSDTVEQHKALAQGTAAEAWVKDSHYSFVYPTRKDYEADRFIWSLRKKAGFDPQILEGDEAHEFEPNLSRDFTCLAMLPDHGYIRNPGAYIADLAQEVERLGGRILKANMQDFVLRDGKIHSVVTDEGTIECTHAVLATGAWSRSLSQKLGLSVPLETERGYHVEYSAPENGPNSPLMLTSGKFVAMPMAKGLRCAGVLEFGGLQAGASEAPLKLMRKKVRETFPKMTFKEESIWLGHRPAPSDSLPLIGEIRKSGIFTGFGHHHIGLTAGPKTGRILAGLITGQNQAIDLTPYDPGRF